MTEEQPAQRRGAVHPVRRRTSRRCPTRRGASSARRPFFRLWVAQCVSSLGDWIGLIAILAIAARVSDNSGAAVSLVMTTRVLPGFLLGTVGGVIIDRFDRRKVMVLCDIGRASLLVLPAVRREPGRSPPGLARPRDAHAPVGSGAGRVGAQPGARGAAVVGELALARRELRHVPDRVDHLLVARRGWRRCSAISTSSPRSRSTRKRSRSIFDAMTFLVSAAIVWRLPDPASRPFERQAHRLDRDLPRDQGRVAVRLEARAGARRDARARVRPHRRRRDDPARSELRARRCSTAGAAAFGVLMTALGFGAAHRRGHAVVAPEAACRA